MRRIRKFEKNYHKILKNVEKSDKKFEKIRRSVKSTAFGIKGHLNPSAPR